MNDKEKIVNILHDVVKQTNNMLLSLSNTFNNVVNEVKLFEEEINTAKLKYGLSNNEVEHLREISTKIAYTTNFTRLQAVQHWCYLKDLSNN